MIISPIREPNEYIMHLELVQLPQQPRNEIIVTNIPTTIMISVEMSIPKESSDVAKKSTKFLFSIEINDPVPIIMTPANRNMKLNKKKKNLKHIIQMSIVENVEPISI